MEPMTDVVSGIGFGRVMTSLVAGWEQYPQNLDELSARYYGDLALHNAQLTCESDRLFVNAEDETSIKVIENSVQCTVSDQRGMVDSISLNCFNSQSRPCLPRCSGI